MSDQPLRPECTRQGLAKMLRPLWDAAKDQGWTIHKTGGSHIRWVPPSGSGWVISGQTPSSQRAFKATRAQLRRAGLEV